MRIGENERAMLEEIEQVLKQQKTESDAGKSLLVSFLLSGGSTKRMYQHMHGDSRSSSYDEDLYARLKQRKHRILRQLERKKLIRLSTNNSDSSVYLTGRAHRYLSRENFIALNKNITQKWDGKWTLVMFDMPTNARSERYELIRVLYEIGFVQVQQSNYAFPFHVRHLEDFLYQRPIFREHCQVFRGDFIGNDSQLRKKFKLSSM